MLIKEWLRGGGATPKMGYKSITFTKFSLKLHENERSWPDTPGSIDNAV